MSARENFVNLEGNLATTPELRMTPTGKSVTTLTIAHSERYMNEHGQWVDGSTSYIDVAVWDRLAEHAVASYDRGDRVTVTGRLNQRSWTDKNTGAPRYKVEVIADSVNTSIRFATTEATKASFGGRDKHDEQRQAAELVRTATGPVEVPEYAAEEEPF